MRHLWSVLCGKVIVEEKTEKISLIDIPEVLLINAAAREIAHTFQGSALGLNCSLVIVFWCETGSDPVIEVRIAFIDPAGKRSKETMLEFPSGREKETIRVIVKIEALAFRGIGVYGIEIRWREKGTRKRWRLASWLPLDVRVNPAPTEAVPPSAPTLSAPLESS